MSEMIGEWSIDWDAFAQRYGVSDLEGLVNSPRHPAFGGGGADDFSASVGPNRELSDLHIRPIPFGEAHQWVQDSDLVVYVYHKLGEADLVGLLKQRGHHAEICYLDDAGVVHQTAPWGSKLQSRPIIEEEHPNRVMHIFRIRMPAVSTDREHALKRQVHWWRRIFNKHMFPAGGDQYTGSHRYMDPADFATLDELASLAVALIDRAPTEQPRVPKVTCVQWAFQVLCLAVCLPVNERTLDSLGVRDAYRRNWERELGLADPNLVGLDVLPFTPSSPAQVLQSYLDVYCEGVPLLHMMEDADSPIAEVLGGALSSQKLPGFSDAVAGYLDAVRASGDMSLPLLVPGRPPYRFVMPITPFCESRKPPDDPESPWCQYVATAFNGVYLSRES